MVWKPVCLSLLLAILLNGIGCRERERTIDSPEALEEYAALPGLTQSSSGELQVELARLIEESATPLLLLNHRQVTKSDDSSRRKANFDQVFPKQFRHSLRERLDKVWPAEGFRFSSATLHVAAALLNRYDQNQERYRELVTSPGFAFDIDHARGVSADVAFLESVHIGNRLEGLLGAQHLADGELDSAIESVRVMLQVCESLADEQSIVCRGSAVHERASALQVVEGIAQHPLATRLTHRQLATMLTQQLHRWPSDAKAWIGDRAQGLHTFELLRDGYLLSLLTYEEIRAYRDKMGIQELGNLVARNMDVDELFYLKTMRDVIDSCEKPFYERIELFSQIEDNLEILRTSESYPFVSDELLLGELWQGQRLQALDRARCEAWALALHQAAGHEPATPLWNPLTGDHFVVEITAERVVVDAIDPATQLRAAIVPIKPSAPAPTRVGAPMRRATTQ